jgi:hypothetical protein
MRLVDRATGEQLSRGDKVETFRGERGRLQDFRAPHKPSSSGRIWVKIGDYVAEFFPSVINAEFRS